MTRSQARRAAKAQRQDAEIFLVFMAIVLAVASIPTIMLSL